ncbi:threonine aldolase family protein [Streptomyces sp. NPDC054796]
MEARERKLRVWAGAERRLGDLRGADRLGDLLTRLKEEGARSYDLTDWPDIYGNDDSIVGALELRTAETLGTESAAYFPTGTMAQQAALRCWATRTGNPTVALHPLAHPVRWERDALRRLSGLHVVHPGDGAPRMFSADEIRDCEEPFGTLMLELPLRDAGFVLPTWEELTATVEAARERDAVVHLDGARLWECATHFGRPLQEIASVADSVYVSFYKSLGALSGAALAGPATLVEEAVAWRHRYGGALFQQWPAVLSALVGFDQELPRLPSYVAHARLVAEAMREALTASGEAWWRVWPEAPHTHQFQVWLPYGAEDLEEASLRYAEESGTLLFRAWSEAQGGPPGVSMSEVTVSAPGLSWTREHVSRAVEGFLRTLAGVTGASGAPGEGGVTGGSA